MKNKILKLFNHEKHVNLSPKTSMGAILTCIEHYIDKSISPNKLNIKNMVVRKTKKHRKLNDVYLMRENSKYLFETWVERKTKKLNHDIQSINNPPIEELFEEMNKMFGVPLKEYITYNPDK